MCICSQVINLLNNENLQYYQHDDGSIWVVEILNKWQVQPGTNRIAIEVLPYGKIIELAAVIRLHDENEPQRIQFQTQINRKISASPLPVFLECAKDRTALRIKLHWDRVEIIGLKVLIQQFIDFIDSL